ncbi:Type 1 glutamine amidotransferase-like domain-containing protein [Shewanella submarina]|uniref:Type 1 glutamine amidotransferase-like domain-containing protein n=1 Tax=Shewanella submarina TaxID=2016376 RepID=A0ABV7GFV8_9GAMM|nr:Type 1 glutamine amidotransferase-like domain-containing protein [Shewanella submarina]MCL1036013.1 Type 1 glutamine amidotransferase-like domain-containing protein [Shewanella submarina]
MELVLLSSMDSKHASTAVAALRARLHSDSSEMTAAYIASQPDPNREYYRPVKDWYASLGIEMNLYLELEQGYDAKLVDRLLACDIIHLSGGDTFRFLYWLKQRELLLRLKEFALSGGGLVGLSAGAMILAPSIASAAVCGDRNDIGLQDPAGAGLMEFNLVPHLPLDDNHGWLRQADQFRPVVLLHDQDVLALQGQEWVSFGSPVWKV